MLPVVFATVISCVSLGRIIVTMSTSRLGICPQLAGEWKDVSLAFHVFLGVACLLAADSQAAEPRADNVPAAIAIREIAAPNPVFRRKLEFCDMPRAVAFSGDGTLLATGGCRTGRDFENSYGFIKIWALSKNQVLTTIKATDDFGDVSRLVFLPGAHELVSVAHIFRNDGTDSLVQFWDVASGRQTVAIKLDNKLVSGLVVSKDARWLGIGVNGDDQTAVIKIWDVTKAQFQTDVKARCGGVRSIQLSPDGTLLISAGDDSTIRVWDVARWQVVRELVVQSRDTDVAVSPAEEDSIAAVVDGRSCTDALIWNYRTGKRLRSLEGEIFALSAMVFSRDGKMLLTGGGGRVMTGDPRDSIPPLGSPALAPIRVWDVGTGANVCSVPGVTGDAHGLAFSPCGKLFVTSDTESCAIRLWKLP